MGNRVESVVIYAFLDVMTQQGGLAWTKRKWIDFESFVEGVLYDRDLSISARIIRIFLNPFSYLFYGIVRMRLFCILKTLLSLNPPRWTCHRSW